jgi:hypothetical protein
VIFHTKYPNNFRASLRSAQFLLCALPPTWNHGSAPVLYPSIICFVNHASSKCYCWKII